MKLWNNSISEIDNAKDHVVEKFIHKTGIHHLSVFEDVIENEKYIFVAAVSFNGEIHILKIQQNGDIEVLKDAIKEKDSYWAVKFAKDPESKNSRFAATLPNGLTKIWNFSVVEGQPHFQLEGELKGEAFPTCLDLSIEQDKLSIGYQNGDVSILEISSLKPIFTFHNSSLQKSSNSTVRSVKFSPLGSLLAVGKDVGSNGLVTIYDTTYGETIGSLTIPSHSSKTVTGAYTHEGWVFAIDFNESGESLVSAGYDGKLRVWDVETRERQATISLSPTDLDDEDIIDVDGQSPIVGAKFIKKGTRGGAGGDSNDGLVAISLDKGIRWYREAGGV